VQLVVVLLTLHQIAQVHKFPAFSEQTAPVKEPNIAQAVTALMSAPSSCNSLLPDRRN
jgi:hypothetical protein